MAYTSLTSDPELLKNRKKQKMKKEDLNYKTGKHDYEKISKTLKIEIECYDKTMET